MPIEYSRETNLDASSFKSKRSGKTSQKLNTKDNLNIIADILQGLCWEAQIARKGGEIIAAQLRQVGIQTVITNLEWSQWLEEVFRNKDFGLTIVAHTEPFDIGIYGRPDYYFQYDSKDFQGIMDSLTSETDPKIRMDLLKKAQTMISNDYVNGFLFQRPNLSVINAKVSGIWANSPTQATDVTAVSWQ